MRKSFILLGSLALLLWAHSLPRQKASGHLFIIGGGSRPEQMMERYAALAKQSPQKRTVIFPLAGGSPEEAGKETAEEFRKLGLPDVEYLILTREQAENPDSIRLLDGAGSIYFTGGDQSRLTKALVGTPIHRRMLELYRQGAVIGGTSAGAAVMSDLMITGNEKRPVKDDHAFEKILADNIEITPGFGFITSAIIDQHFVTRKRHNRLISLVAEHPDLLGIGIDESTAILVDPDETFEVIGEQNVIVYDARGAQVDIQPGKILSGYHLVMHILKPGDRFDLNARKPIVE